MPRHTANESQSRFGIRSRRLRSHSTGQLVTGPTRDNLLDIVVGQKDECIVEEVQVDDAGCLSDHRLVLAQLRIGWRRKISVTFKYRRIRQMDYVQFETNVCASSLFTSPAENVDEYVSSRWLPELAQNEIIYMNKNGKN